MQKRQAKDDPPSGPKLRKIVDLDEVRPRRRSVPRILILTDATSRNRTAPRWLTAPSSSHLTSTFRQPRTLPYLRKDACHSGLTAARTTSWSEFHKNGKGCSKRHVLGIDVFRFGVNSKLGQPLCLNHVLNGRCANGSECRSRHRLEVDEYNPEVAAALRPPPRTTHRPKVPFKLTVTSTVEPSADDGSRPAPVFGEAAQPMAAIVAPESTQQETRERDDTTMSGSWLA